MLGRTAWERRHPCLLVSISRSLPETSQARMPALPGRGPKIAILYLRSSIFVTGGLTNLLLGYVEFGAGDAHRQHHLFFRAFAFGDFGQPLSLTFAAMMDAEAGDDQQNSHCARRRPSHLRRLKKLRESFQPARLLPRLFPLL